jgi:hypothetical protein
MKRTFLASCAALLVLAPVLALAQSRTPPAGSTTVGTAAPRGGESSGTTSSSGSASDRGGSSVGSSGGNNGGSSGSGFSSSPAGSAGTRYDGPRSGESSGSARSRAGANVGQPVPPSERPRGDRPVTGQAVARTTPKPPDAAGGVASGNWSDYPGFWGYDPYGYGYGSYGYGYFPYYGGYGYSPYYGYDWGSWGPWMAFGPLMGSYSYWSDYYGGGGATYADSVSGSIRLKVNPKDAEVYVDGTYYGHVDDYDGTFQHLDLRAGTHRLEIRASGYEPLKVELRVLPGKSITYSGALKAVK